MLVRRFLLPLLLVLLAAPAALAQQPSALYADAERQPIRVSVEGIYQQFTDEGEELTEFSIPFGLRIPFGQNIALSLNTNYATVNGSTVETVSGMGDLQALVSYFQPLGAASLVFSIGVNATTGNSALTFDEFRTSTLAGQTAYDLRVPTFGQGLRVAPAVTYAFPVGEKLALGLGASYQYRGPYEPLEDLPDTYDPGEEVLLTGGADFEVTALSSFSLDVSLGLNGEDSFGPPGSQQTFEPGNTISVTGQYRQEFGFHEVRAVARYRARGQGALPDSPADAETAVPTTIQFFTDGRFQVAPAFDVGARARVRRYSESPLFDGTVTLFDIGIVPAYRVTDQVGLTSRFTYTFGSFSGFTAGGGLRLAL